MVRTRGRARSSDSGLIEMLDIAEILVIYIIHQICIDIRLRLQFSVSIFFPALLLFPSIYLGKKGEQ